MSDRNAFALAGLLGWPVAQSRSPVIQNFWLQQHGVAGRYILLPVTPEKLDEALRGLGVLGFRGCNVTMPHKQGVMPMLDRVEPMARRIGAVNTIAVQEDGSLRGFNNDGVGFVQSVYDAEPGCPPGDAPILTQGAGGCRPTVAVAPLEHGPTDIR